MALIIMAVHDTEENGRTDYTRQTLFGSSRGLTVRDDKAGYPKASGGLLQTVNWSFWTEHRMIIVDNGSCEATKKVIREFAKEANRDFLQANGTEIVTIIPVPVNIGTARAVNKGLAFRKPGEYCIKMDNDVVIDHYGWIEQMEDAMKRMPTMGILGLKRRDLLESPYSINTDQRSRLLEVPHQAGQRWYVVEDCKHVMGTCTMLSPQLLDRIGFFKQPGLYGFDDSLLCVRSTVAGFLNCFLHGIDIDHIDPGGTPYTDWKAKAAGEVLTAYGQEEAAYKSGVKDVFYAGE